MKNLACVLGICLALGAAWPAEGCTIVMAAKNGVVLAGNNEDWKNPATRIWFVPASNGEHGLVCSRPLSPVQTASRRSRPRLTPPAGRDTFIDKVRMGIQADSERAPGLGRKRESLSTSSPEGSNQRHP